MSSAAGTPAEPIVAPDKGDRRFNAVEWREMPGYSLLKQTYLLNSRLIGDLIEASDVDEATRNRLRFYSKQFIDSMSPANFAATNPDVAKLAFDTQGESLKAGFSNLLEDMRKGRLSITDESAFEVGKNVAVSPGSVVFENELLQLSQYAPLTKQVASRPLLIVPPCIAGHPGRPYRAVALSVPHNATGRRQVAICARRQRPYRRGHQPCLEEQTQLLDRRRPGRGPAGLAGQRAIDPRQLVAPLEPVAQTQGRQAGCRAQRAGQQALPGHRAGAGALRQRAGKLSTCPALFDHRQRMERLITRRTEPHVKLH